jgi:peptidoglycan/LPS O-acetylase OafA/YrhL
MQYRKEIDGLRAIAVLPVLFYHAGFDLFSGGFVGVDVFFVISGYLITSIIIREKSEGTFTFAHFCERRVRRIIPALFLVMLCCIPFAWFLMAPHQLKDFSQSLLSTTIFLSNVFFYLETDYFNDFAETAPLLHTWSLAVEEQYYILFPPLLLIVWRLGAKWAVGIFGAIAVASLVGAEWASVHAPTANFYLLPSRAWELLIGVLAALYLLHNEPCTTRTGTISAEILSGIGLLAIFYAVFAFDAQTPLPGLWGLIPTLGTALIILFTSPLTWVGRFLSVKSIVGVGLISYSLYLWHQPLLAFARIKNLGPLDWAESTAIIILSFVLAYGSYLLCETRFKNASFIKTRYLYVSAAVMGIAFISLGYSAHITNGFISYKVSQMGEKYGKLVFDKNRELSRRKTTWAPLMAESERPFDDAPKKKRVLLLGDSKSKGLYAGLVFNMELFSAYQVRRVGLDDPCMFGEEELRATNLLEEADIVVFSNTWEASSIHNANKYIEELSSKKDHVYIVGTANFNDVSSVSMQAAENLLSGIELEHFLFQNIRHDQRKLSNKMADEFSDTVNVTYLDKLKLFCDFSAERCGLFSEAGDPYYIDHGHVSVEGAQYYGRRAFEENWLKARE